MNCTACGKPLTPAARFCANCGNPAASKTGGLAIPPAVVSSPLPRDTSVRSTATSNSGRTNAPAPAAPSGGPIIQERSPGKRLIAGLLVIAIVGGIVLASSSSPGPNAPDVTTGNRNRIVASNGDTACFALTPPADATTTAFTGIDCEIYVRFGPDQLSSLRITPSYALATDLAEQVEDWKNSSASMNYAVTAESDIAAGPYEARKLVYRRISLSGDRQTTDNLNLQIFTGDKYTVQDLPLTGFEINASYATAADKAAVDTVIAGIRWK